MDNITEALLEMHFHRVLINKFSKKLNAKFKKLIKPSPREEAWVGFDQGWISCKLGSSEFMEELKTAVSSSGKVRHLYFAYFLQFKRVELIERKVKHMPRGFVVPFYRSELSLKPNKTTGISQHETLIKLSQIRNSHVFYACGMLFEINDVFEEPDINKLRLVDINSAPSGWSTNEAHFICFRDVFDNSPVWCSKETEGKALSFDEWIEGNDNDRTIKLLQPQDVLELINDTMKVLSEEVAEQKNFIWKDYDRRNYKYLPESMTILKFEVEDK